LYEKLKEIWEPPLCIAMIHGGPGAPGEMVPVARDRFYDILKKELR